MPFNFDLSPENNLPETSKPHNPSRRRFLRAGLQMGLAASTTLILPKAFAQTQVIQAERKLSLLNLHTGESLTATYWADGQYQQDELAAINHLLRDHRTGDIHAMDTSLLELLNTLHGELGSKEAFQIISGYRSPKTNAALHKKSNGVATHSLHMQGKAIDIRLPDCQLTDLRKAALQCQRGGVGYYAKSNFVHVDTGRVRHWG